MQFQYKQIVGALPQHWKETTKQFAGNVTLYTRSSFNKV